MRYTLHHPTSTINGLFADMLAQNHLLIGGASGSGKSVLENDLIYTCLADSNNELILIDPKKVELYRYRNLPQIIAYADETTSIVNALQLAIAIMDKRYNEMRKRNELLYSGNDIYIFIDEFADLMTTNKKAIAPMVQRLGQLARASRIHLILCTQKPTSDIIPTSITVNIVGRVALGCRNSQESRNVINYSGAELINRKGVALYTNEQNRNPLTVSIPMYTQEEIQQRIDYYIAQKPKQSIFARLFRR